MDRSGDRGEKRWWWVAAMLLAVVSLVTCGGAPESASAGSGTGSAGGADRSQGESTAGEADTPEPVGYCSNLSIAEIEAAFGNVVSFGEGPTRDEENMCVYSVEDAAGMRQFQFTRRADVGEYERAKATHEGSGMALEPVSGIGLDAYLVNESQLEILVSEDEAILLVVGVMVFGQESPLGQEAKRRGLLDLAAKLIERT